MPSTPYNFDTYPDRRGHGSLKWDKYQDRDILPLWVADMDFTSAPEILAAINERLNHGVFGYTIPYKEPIQAILKYLKQRHSYETRASKLDFLPGLVPAINMCCHAFTQAGDSVMTATPVYPPFLTAPDYSKRELITVPLCLNHADQWTFDFDAMEAAIKPNTQMFILCNPHNPVGRVYTREELLRLGDFCEKHDLILISDEIHCDLIFDKSVEHIATATLSKSIAERTITLMAPSKTYNLPGLAFAFSVIENDKLRLQFRKAIRGIITEVNCFGYAAATAAYSHGEPWRQELLNYLRNNYELIRQFIPESIPEIIFRPMESTYLAWFDVSRLELENPVQFFESHKIGLSDGAPFGSPQHVRLNFGCPRDQLLGALETMAKAVQNR